MRCSLWEVRTVLKSTARPQGFATVHAAAEFETAFNAAEAEALQALECQRPLVQMLKAKGSSGYDVSLMPRHTFLLSLVGEVALSTDAHLPRRNVAVAVRSSSS